MKDKVWRRAQLIDGLLFGTLSRMYHIATTLGQSLIGSHSPFGPKRGFAGKCNPSPWGLPMGTAR